VGVNCLRCHCELFPVPPPFVGRVARSAGWGFVHCVITANIGIREPAPTRHIVRSAHDVPPSPPLRGRRDKKREARVLPVVSACSRGTRDEIAERQHMPLLFLSSSCATTRMTGNRRRLGGRLTGRAGGKYRQSRRKVMRDG
jgi:hypothetical protein